MSRKKIQPPRDIKDLVHKNIAKRIIKSVLVMATLGVIFCFLGEEMFASVPSPSKEMIYVLAIAIVPICFGIPHKLIDRSWTGEITRVDVRSEYASRGALKNGAGIYTKYFADIEIKLDNGKIIDRTVYVGVIASDRNFNTFKVGDRVVHLYGTDHVQVIHENLSRPTVCVVCGTANPPEETHCDTCGHTLHITY